MRQEYILYKRQMKKGQNYYVKFWDIKTKAYVGNISVGSIKMRLGEKAWHISHTSKAGAQAIVNMWLKDGASISGRDSFYDYLSTFWGEDSEYVNSKKLRGQDISKMYIANNHSGIKNYVLPFLENNKLQNLTIAQIKPETLEKLLSHLSTTPKLKNKKPTDDKLSHRRVNAIYQGVTVALSEAERLGKINVNPAKKVKKLIEVKPVRKILTLSEAKNFFLKSPEADYRCYVINLLAATSGMRLGECRGLLKENLYEKYIDVKQNWQDGEGLKEPKWGSRRSVPLPPKTHDALINLIEMNPFDSDFVFYGNTPDLPINKTMIEKYYKDTLVKIKIDEEERKDRNLNFHAWRHFYNTRLRGNIPDHALKMLTGHKNEQMTDRYTTITDEQRTAVAQLADDII